MAYYVIEVLAWVCDSCGLEAIPVSTYATTIGEAVGPDGLPEGWELMGTRDTEDGQEPVHWCAVCAGRGEVPC